MARIRTIKPDFWQDDKVGEMSQGARLLAIAVLNFADDEGRFQATPKRLKQFAFGYDNITESDVNGYLNELKAHRYIIEYSMNNETYYQVRTFNNNQVISRPRPSRYPPPIHGVIIEPSMTPTGDSIGKGREGKGKERNSTCQTPTTEHFEGWAKAYPSVDVQAEWLKAQAWMTANPHRPKKRPMSFFNNWLARASKTTENFEEVAKSWAQ